MAAADGVDVERVTAWFTEHVPGVRPPLDFGLVAGGRSNLTYIVTDEAEGRWVLRRPPLGRVLATAHDMGREHRIISALGPTAVPVPPALGLCTDESVNGAPFYVMGYVDGLVIRGAKEAEALGEDARRRAGESLVDTLAAIHDVDPAAVGLGDLGRTEGYIERQLKRWYGQWEKSKSRELSAMEDTYARLMADIPEQGPATIVHGDYRLDNCMLSPDGDVRAVLDWEICTLGDPLADVGVLCVYWAEPDDDLLALPGAATTLPGFPRRADLLARYAARTGRDLGEIDFYVAFGYWKLAAILEGVAARYAAGVMGDDDPDTTQFFFKLVESLADKALATTAKAGR